MHNKKRLPLLVASLSAVVSPAVFAIDEAVISAAGTELNAGMNVVGGVLLAAAAIWVTFRWVKSALKSG